VFAIRVWLINSRIDAMRVFALGNALQVRNVQNVVSVVSTCQLLQGVNPSPVTHLFRVVVSEELFLRGNVRTLAC